MWRGRSSRVCEPGGGWDAGCFCLWAWSGVREVGGVGMVLTIRKAFGLSGRWAGGMMRASAGAESLGHFFIIPTSCLIIHTRSVRSD